MTPKFALYNVIETELRNLPNGAQAANAQTFRSLRGNVEEANRVVRVDALQSGRLSVSNEPQRRFQDADCIVQCYVAPDDADSIESLDEAVEQSLMMAYEIYDIIRQNPTLDGEVCDSFAVEPEYDSDTANFAGRLWGATYFYGKINT